MVAIREDDVHLELTYHDVGKGSRVEDLDWSGGLPGHVGVPVWSCERVKWHLPN